MRKWKRRSREKKKKTGLGLAEPGHTASREIDEASRIADEAIKLQAVGEHTMVQSNSVHGMRLVAAIEKALEKSPNDLDLLVAKSGALCSALQFKTAEDLIDQVLSINPEHFEARKRKDHWAKWEHLFHYPPWSSKATTLHPIMAARLQYGIVVQIVRDGLQVGIAVVRPAQRQQFPRGLSNRMRSKWEPVWSQTPHGPIVAHYLLVEDNPANPYSAEGFLQTSVPDEVAPSSAYWLLQRMSNLGSCFLVIAEGSKVLYNARYVFPDALRSTLRSISDKLVRQPVKMDRATFQRACQWHMQNFDMKRIRF